MKKLFLFLVIGLAANFAIAEKVEYQLKKVNLFKGHIEISVPSSFTVLKDFEIEKTYPREDPPKLVYGNQDRSIRIAFDIEDNGATQDQIGNYGATFIKVFNKIYQSPKWKRQEVIEQDQRKIGVLEFLAKKPEKQHKFFFYTDYHNKLLTCNIDHPKKKHKKWKPVAQEIMESLVIKDEG